jgi:hypothetical protein
MEEISGTPKGLTLAEILALTGLKYPLNLTMTLNFAAMRLRFI